MPFSEQPHRRFNPLKNEWILVSPHRANRPWQGQQDQPDDAVRPNYDPACYLCAGNARAGGLRNPDYKNIFIFDNDFAALVPGDTVDAPEESGLFRAAPANGTCRVICFSPDHGKTLPEMSAADIRVVVDNWATQEQELSATHAYVQIFENKGAMMGCSSPHPHGQIWATDYVPAEPAREDETQASWFGQHQSSMLLTYAQQEAQDGARTVAQNDSWIAVVPYWASWPYEILLLPLFGVQSLSGLSDGQRDDLASIMKAVTTAYDNLFQTSFPYSMGWHGAPGTADAPHWQLHAHFYPPLLRSASVRKFMVGYEMLAEAQRDLTPETAAENLRNLRKIHYRCEA